MRAVRAPLSLGNRPAVSVSLTRKRLAMAGRDENKVFVGGLSPQTTDYSLAMHFSGYGAPPSPASPRPPPTCTGQIVECRIIMDRSTGKSKGYGFVTFASPQSAAMAVANPAPFIDGKVCNCNLATDRSGTRPPPGPPPGPESRKTTFDQRFGGAPEASAAKRPRVQDFLESLVAQGEDLSPPAVVARTEAKLSAGDAPSVLRYFLERAEAVRGYDDFEYLLGNLVAAARHYHETVRPRTPLGTHVDQGENGELPPRGSQEALEHQQLYAGPPPQHGTLPLPSARVRVG